MENLRDERDITPQKEYVTWSMIDHFINHLEDLIKENNFNGVYGPARGGLLFAVMISHKYNLPFLAAPQVGCLIVDDIVDTGETALAWHNKGYKICSMYYKKNNLVEPNLWLYEKKDQWISFPWEDIRSDEDMLKAETIIDKVINQLYYKSEDESIVEDFKNAISVLQGGRFNE